MQRSTFVVEQRGKPAARAEEFFVVAPAGAAAIFFATGSTAWASVVLLAATIMAKIVILIRKSPSEKDSPTLAIAKYSTGDYTIGRVTDTIFVSVE